MNQEDTLLIIAFTFYLINLTAAIYYIYRFQHTIADLVHNIREHRDSFNDETVDEHHAEELRTTAEAVADLIIGHVVARGTN